MFEILWRKNIVTLFYSMIYEMFISILLILAFSYFYFFRENYISELVISFLPYIWAILLLMVIYRLFMLWRKIFTKKVVIPWSVSNSPIFLILCWILFFLYFSELQVFYNQDLLEDHLDNPIKIFYSNIYKDNVNFSWIIASIEKENPDVVMFVEYSDAHENWLKEYFSEKYPYYDKTNWSKIYGWSVVMSKYPVTNFINDFAQEDSWKYGYFKVEKDWIPYYFYLLHTSSPVSSFDYQKRNQQFITVKKDFYQQHESSREKNSKIVMLGDFNVSPWSIFYKRFAQSFPLFNNITRSQKIFFSWNLAEMLKIHEDFSFLPQWFRDNVWYFPILWSHIDHVFVSDSLKVSDFKKIHIDWTDHDWMVFSIE